MLILTKFDNLPVLKVLYFPHCNHTNIAPTFCFGKKINNQFLNERRLKGAKRRLIECFELISLNNYILQFSLIKN